MPRLAEIEARIASMDALLDVVSAMRSMAAIRVQEASRALTGVRRYAGVVAGAIGSVLPLLDDPPGRGDGPRLLVLLGAEHGFAGGYNERLMERLEQIQGDDDHLFVLGSRSAVGLAERGRATAWQSAMPTRIEGIQDTAIALGDALAEALVREKSARVEVLFSRFQQMGQWSVELHSLLPLDLTAFPLRRSAGLPPLLHLPPAALLSRLAEEYLQALLTEKLVEAVSSENAARFAAMESAHGNVGKKLEQLREEANRVRQDEITMELLDLVTGAEAAGAP